MALQTGPYYSNALDQPEKHDLTNKHGPYPDLDPSMAPNAHMYSLADGALQVHQKSTDRQFAGLIQAATAAAGQEASYAEDHNGLGTLRRTTRQTRANISGELLRVIPNILSSSPDILKIKIDIPQSLYLAQSYPENDASNASRKRKRQSHPTGLPQVSSPLQAEGATTDESHTDRERDPLQETASNNRLAGMQSATALFRSPSASSKKYTRPPMSKLFTSLELSPEVFLHLQAAAKSYMLDPDHPERSDCVGQRGKGDSELVKMRLWNCVATFLDEEGNGQLHFGEDVLGEGGATRSMEWPQDRSKVIGAVIPLLRRMVTNERQRQYAVETRKGGSAGHAKRQRSDSGLPLSEQNTVEQRVKDQSDVGDMRINNAGFPPGEKGRSTPSARCFIGTTPYNSRLRLRINILEGQHRIRPCFEVSAEECPDLEAIYTNVLLHYGDAILERVTVSVLLPQGLTGVGSDEDWVRALSVVQATEWMDGETKVIVEVA
jgi:hypothetical protein